MISKEIFDKTSNGVYKAPEYLSYGTENTVKIWGLGILIAVTLLVLLLVFFVIKIRHKKSRKGDNYDNLSDNDKKIRDILYKRNKRDTKIGLLLVIIVMVIVGVLLDKEYNKYLSSNRFVYSEEIVDKLNEDNRNKVTGEVKSVEILDKATNYTNELFKNKHKELGNNYIGQSGNEYTTLYKVKATLKNGEEVELDAQLLPSSTDEDNNKISYIKGEKDEKLNGLITMDSDKIDEILKSK